MKKTLPYRHQISALVGTSGAPRKMEAVRLSEGCGIGINVTEFAELCL